MTSALSSHMPGPKCCRVSAIDKSHHIRSFVHCEGTSLHTQKNHPLQSVKVALPPLHPSSPRAHSFKLVTRAPATASLSRAFRRSGKGRKLHQDVYILPNQETCGHISPCTSMTSFHNHASSCILAADGKVGATIWHALLPARHLASLECDSNMTPMRSISVGRSGIDSVSSMMLGGSVSDLVDNSSKPLSNRLRPGGLSLDNVALPKLSSLNVRTAMAGCLSEGSWNAAWDARPARWLHGRHSAWLLFGVCACFSAASGPFITPASSPVLTEAGADGVLPSAALSNPDNLSAESTSVTLQTEQSGHGKEIITDYIVTGIPGDGRCLFRAVAHGSCLRRGRDAPDETTQRQLADELRSSVADELIKRRDSTEWFIEGDFDEYVERMRQTHVWGGEPELLMLSHVLEMPITVYMIEVKTKSGLIAIAEYGQEYRKTDPIRVLYHGFGHYEALQIPSNKADSKL